MADDKSAVKAAAAEEKAFHGGKVPDSRKPSESGDPTVHKLIADRRAHEMNLENLEAETTESVAAAKDAIKGIDKELGDLGYKV